IVPLATPARLATSSSRAASKPRDENSSSAAARIASWRAALRSLRAALRGSGPGRWVAPRRRRGVLRVDRGCDVVMTFTDLLVSHSLVRPRRGASVDNVNQISWLACECGFGGPRRSKTLRSLALGDQPLASQKKVRITHSLPPSL